MSETLQDLEAIDPGSLGWLAAGPPSELQRRAAARTQPASLEDCVGVYVGKEAQAFLELDTRWLSGLLDKDTTPFSPASLRQLSFDRSRTQLEMPPRTPVPSAARC